VAIFDDRSVVISDVEGNNATVTPAGAVEVDGSAVTQPVSSIQLPATLVGGRLDENVGAWLGSTAPTVGQKTMASSVPVAIASDQTAVPVSGTLTTVEQTVASFMASTNGVVPSGTVLATVASIAYLFHTVGSTKTIKIRRIDITVSDAPTGNFTARGAFITAENGAPGGTVQAINGTNRANTAEGTDTFRTGATGAPTRVAGDLLSGEFGSESKSYTWEAPPGTLPITLRAGVAEGFEIRTVITNALVTPSLVAVTFYWTEEP
jgi:hypothetical protein